MCNSTIPRIPSWAPNGGHGCRPANKRVALAKQKPEPLPALGTSPSREQPPPPPPTLSQHHFTPNPRSLLPGMPPERRYGRVWARRLQPPLRIHCHGRGGGGRAGRRAARRIAEIGALVIFEWCRPRGDPAGSCSCGGGATRARLRRLPCRPLAVLCCALGSLRRVGEFCVGRCRANAGLSRKGGSEAHWHERRSRSIFTRDTPPPAGAYTVKITDRSAAP